MIIKWTIYCWILPVIFTLGHGKFVRVCYHTNWAQYRPEPFKFKPENIDADLCTHIVYAFGKVVGNKIEPYEWNDLILQEYTKDNYEKVAALKMANPNLKITLAIGGWNHGSGPFTDLVDNTADIRAFAVNAIEYLRMINFDGLDLDWEYPAHRGSPPGDREKFTELCQILHEEFENEAKQTGKPRLLLTAAVAAGDAVATAYEINKIAKVLDYIHLMSYDFHGSWDSTLGHNSPLYPRGDESVNDKRLNQEYAINFWLMAGTPKEKLVVGLALYGRSFTMETGSHQLGAQAKGAGTPGAYTREPGFLAYYEVCDKLKSGWKRVWNEEQRVPFAYSGNQWVGYDDLESIAIKANYIKSHDLGGSMVWAMDLDDFGNSCKQGPNPLMSKIKEVLNTSSVQPPKSTTTPQKTQPTTSLKATKPPATTNSPSTEQPTKPRTTTNSPSTEQPTKPRTTKSTTSRQTTQLHPTSSRSTQNLPSSFQPSTCGAPLNCENGKFYVDQCNNTVYYQCAHGISYRYECHAGTVWYINRCEWDYLVSSSRSPSAVSSTKKSSKISTIKSTTIQTTTLSPSTTQSLCSPFQCPNNGLYADPCDVQSYFNCWGGVAYHYTCADETVWNDDTSNCDWEYNVKQSENCAPGACESGEYYADKCDDQVYYQCAGGRAYKFRCADGTYWNQDIINCDWLR